MDEDRNGVVSKAEFALQMRLSKDDPKVRNAHSHGARSVYLIITMTKWIRTSRLSIQNNGVISKAQFAAQMHLSHDDAKVCRCRV